MNINIKKIYAVLANIVPMMTNLDPHVFGAVSLAISVISAFLANADTDSLRPLHESGSKFEIKPYVEGMGMEGVHINLQIPLPIFNTGIQFSLKLPENDESVELMVHFGDFNLDARFKIRRSVVVDIAD